VLVFLFIIYLFICGEFNYAVSSWDYIDSNDRNISEFSIGNYTERCCVDLI
jgi:hypothetical protein